MKQMMLALIAGFSLLAMAPNSVRADDRLPSLRYVDEPGDTARGEATRTKAYNQKNELVAVNVKYNDGHVRNETYEKGVLRLVHESDFKGWSKDLEYDATGVLLTQTVHEKSGKSRVFVNVDAKAANGKDVYLAVGDELHLLRTFDPWPGTRTDTAKSKLTSVLNALAGSPKDLPPNSKLLSSGSFSAASVGDDLIDITTITITPGFASHHGTRPSSHTTHRTIKVHVK